VKFSVCPSILLNNKECSPLRVNEGGQISALGAKFTLRGEIHPWGPGVKGKMALRKLRMSKMGKKFFEGTPYPRQFNLAQPMDQ
jgi:hypothetical protein